jgi:hypothetical protein
MAAEFAVSQEIPQSPEDVGNMLADQFAQGVVINADARESHNNDACCTGYTIAVLRAEISRELPASTDSYVSVTLDPVTKELPQEKLKIVKHSGEPLSDDVQSYKPRLITESKQDDGKNLHVRIVVPPQARCAKPYLAKEGIGPWFQHIVVRNIAMESKYQEQTGILSHHRRVATQRGFGNVFELVVKNLISGTLKESGQVATAQAVDSAYNTFATKLLPQPNVRQRAK